MNQSTKIKQLIRKVFSEVPEDEWRQHKISARKGKRTSSLWVDISIPSIFAPTLDEQRSYSEIIIDEVVKLLGREKWEQPYILITWQ